MRLLFTLDFYRLCLGTQVPHPRCHHHHHCGFHPALKFAPFRDKLHCVITGRLQSQTGHIMPFWTCRHYAHFFCSACTKEFAEWRPTEGLSKWRELSCFLEEIHNVILDCLIMAHLHWINANFKIKLNVFFKRWFLLVFDMSEEELQGPGWFQKISNNRFVIFSGCGSQRQIPELLTYFSCSLFRACASIEIDTLNLWKRWRVNDLIIYSK